LYFVLATIVCFALTKWAVIVAESPLIFGISELPIAVGFYIPLSLWLGIWGCVASYLGNVIAGLSAGYPINFLLIYSLWSFFAGLIPLLAYRALKVDPEFQYKRMTLSNYLIGSLLANIMLAAIAARLGEIDAFASTIAVAITVLLTLIVLERSKAWVLWASFGVIGASLISGLVSAGVYCAFFIGWEAFQITFLRKAFVDVIVLSSIGTPLMAMLTPFVKRKYAFVKGLIT